MAYAGKASDSLRKRLAPKSAPYKQSRPIGTLATGLAIGLLVGAGVALLLAPERGADTRHAIKRRLRRAGLGSRHVWEDLRDELRAARRDFIRARRQRRQDPEPVED
jgi:YtxH-like protein